MRAPLPALSGTALAALASAALAAAPTDLPRYDVEQSCAKLVGTDDPKAPMRNLCIQREQRGYDLTLGLWASASAEDKKKCVDLTERSRSYKYVYLATCLRSSGRTRELSTPQKFRY